MILIRFQLTYSFTLASSRAYTKGNITRKIPFQKSINDENWKNTKKMLQLR